MSWIPWGGDPPPTDDADADADADAFITCKTMHDVPFPDPVVGTAVAPFVHGAAAGGFFIGLAAAGDNGLTATSGILISEALTGAFWGVANLFLVSALCVLSVIVAFAVVARLPDGAFERLMGWWAKAGETNETLAAAAAPPRLLLPPRAPEGAFDATPARGQLHSFATSATSPPATLRHRMVASDGGGGGSAAPSPLAVTVSDEGNEEEEEEEEGEEALTVGQKRPADDGEALSLTGAKFARVEGDEMADVAT